MDTCRFSVEFNVQGSLLKATRQCELDVLRTWYGDTQELIDQAYSRYEDQTVFLAVRESGGDVVGFCRMVRQGDSGLPTLHDVANTPWNTTVDQALRISGVDPRRTWDVTTLGVRRELGASGRIAAAALYYGSLIGGVANSIPWMVSILDSRVRRMLENLGAVYHTIPGTTPQPYMGSPSCEPVYLNVAEVLESQQVWTQSGNRKIRVYDIYETLVPPLDSFAIEVDLRTPEIITLPEPTRDIVA